MVLIGLPTNTDVSRSPQLNQANVVLIHILSKGIPPSNTQPFLESVVNPLSSVGEHLMDTTAKPAVRIRGAM